MIDGRIKLAVFVVVFFTMLVISYSFEKFVFVNVKSAFLEFLIVIPLYLTIVLSGFFVKNLLQLIVQALLGTFILLIFLFSTIYFNPANSENIFTSFYRNQSAVQWLFEFSVIVFACFLGLLAVGILLNYLFRLFFKSKKAE